MKIFSTIMKIVVALAAVAGAIYVVATYGEKITAWAKNLLNSCKCCCDCDGECCCEDGCCCEDDECCCGEDCCCEEELCEAPAEETAEVVEDADFAE